MPANPILFNETTTLLFFLFHLRREDPGCMWGGYKIDEAIMAAMKILDIGGTLTVDEMEFRLLGNKEG
jgi:hypothetical protein